MRSKPNGVLHPEDDPETRSVSKAAPEDVSLEVNDAESQDSSPEEILVSAKNEIMNLIVDLASKGCGVLLVSSELEELMRVCDRYLVMNRGALLNELPGSAAAGELMAAIAEASDGNGSWL